MNRIRNGRGAGGIGFLACGLAVALLMGWVGGGLALGAPASSGGDPPELDAPSNPTGPYLAWELRRERRPDGDTMYHPHAVTWTDATGRGLWRVLLPERLRRLPAGVGDSEAEALREHPRRALELLRFVSGVACVDDAVVIGDTTGLLVLASRDGTRLLDFPDPRTDAEQPLFFDRGTWDIKARDGRAWSGATRRAMFVAPCDERLVWFNGRTLAVFDRRPWRLRRQVAYLEENHREPARPAHVAARFRLDGLDVRLRGIVYLR